MYSLLVVDDEKDVAKSIAYDINWEELDITEVQCVYNGLEALEYMNKRRVDVVLTDIRMPGMDGIRLAEKIADRWKYVKMIFMTGYEEFEYARQALRYGVTEYLLKPAANEELFDAVKKGLDKLRVELKQAAEKESVQAQWERARPLLKEKLLQQWVIKGRELNGEEGELLWGKEQLGKFASLLLLRIDSWDTIYKKQELKYRVVVRKLISEILLKNRAYPLFENADGDLLAVIMEEDQEQAFAAIQDATNMWELFLYSARTTAGCNLSLFYIWECEKTEKVHELYWLLKRHADQHLSMEEGELEEIRPDISNQSFQSIGILEEYPGYEMYVDALDRKGALQKIEELFAEPENGGKDSRFLLVYYHIAHTILRASGIRGISIGQWSGDLSEGFYNYAGFHSIEQLKVWCRQVTEKYIEWCVNENDRECGYLVNQAKKIILERIDKNISVAALAEELYVNASHLTRVFRKETGRSVIQYIQYCKIERARELLRQPGIKIYQVAQMLGYESPAHFNRIFQRQTGMTAKDYQKS